MNKITSTFIMYKSGSRRRDTYTDYEKNLLRGIKRDQQKKKDQPKKRDQPKETWETVRTLFNKHLPEDRHRSADGLYKKWKDMNTYYRQDAASIDSIQTDYQTQADRQPFHPGCIQTDAFPNQSLQPAIPQADTTNWEYHFWNSLIPVSLP